MQKDTRPDFKCVFLPTVFTSHEYSNDAMKNDDKSWKRGKTRDAYEIKKRVFRETGDEGGEK